MHLDIGVLIVLFCVFGLISVLTLYIIYWGAKGLILQNKFRAILAIIIINYPSYHSFKYQFDVLANTVYNIMISILLIYAILYSIKIAK